MTKSEIQVLLPCGGKSIFDYTVPEGLEVEIGDFVEVSFRKKETVGIVWSFVKSEIPISKLKPIKLKYPLPKLTDKHIKFIKFISDYNLADLGLVLKMMIPLQSSFKNANLISHETPPELNLTSPVFTPEQKLAVDKLKLCEGHSVSLLDGVTGSGKTEVYFAAIDHALKKPNSQILVLLPEIMLTTQLISRIEHRFGLKPATWHSGMTLAQKKRLWLDVINSNQRLIIGARSALFLPYQDLNLIIVDEEHDPSYKQEEGVVYNARDAAVACGYFYNIPVILASATPAIETLMNVDIGKYQHIPLENRFGAKSMPIVEIVDMRNESLAKNCWLSSSLVKSIKETMANNKQTMLFLNRRGYAPITLCKSCGHKYICADCSTHLVSHQNDNILACHHCGFTTKQYNKCIECGLEDTLIKCGPGVERIAEEVLSLIPEARVKIITKDTVQDIESSTEVIDAILNNEIDIIIGTQMISKGHDFPNIALVGIVDADLGLTSADLRASEKTYHLLTQMSGRAGRRETGKAIIQTYYPDSPILNSLIEGNRNKFVKFEMQNRKSLEMPPYGKLAAIILSSTSEEKLQAFANKLGKLAPLAKGVLALGPVQAPIAKIRKHFRYRFMIKAKPEVKIQKYLSFWLEKVKIPANIRIKVDIDPYNFL